MSQTPTSVGPTRRLKPVALSREQRKTVAAAYADGQLSTSVLFNRMGRDWPDTSFTLLAQAPLKPAHFNFEGNRGYRMTLVSNGELFGLVSQERVGGRQATTVRLEIVEGSQADLVPVASPPTEAQVRRFYADWLAYLVDGFDAAPLTPEHRAFWWGLGDTQGKDPGREARADLYRTQDAQVVLAEFIAREPAPRARGLKAR